MSKKVLIIEDEEYLIDVYKMKLKKSGYKVFVADNGEDGYKMAVKEKPDIILLDLVMPKKTGFQVFEELKENKDLKDIKICILSNLGMVDDIKKFFKDREDGYLIKASITPADLIIYIEDILSGKKVINYDSELI